MCAGASELHGDKTWEFADWLIEASESTACHSLFKIMWEIYFSLLQLDAESIKIYWGHLALSINIYQVQCCIRCQVTEAFRPHHLKSNWSVVYRPLYIVYICAGNTRRTLARASSTAFEQTDPSAPSASHTSPRTLSLIVLYCLLSSYWVIVTHWVRWVWYRVRLAVCRSLRDNFSSYAAASPNDCR